MATAQKRQPGDMWGLICINTATGEEKTIQIGGWEVNAFPYPRQAQEYADSYNADAVRLNRPERYEIRYAGNRNTLQGITRWCI